MHRPISWGILETMKKQKRDNFWHILSVFTLFFASFFLVSTIRAEESISNLPASKNGLEDQLEEINDKIKAYKKIVDLKERQGSTLADQIKALEAQAAALQGQINATERTLGTLDKDIKTLSVRISEKEELIKNQRKMLSELMRASYADYSTNSALFFLASSSSLSYLTTDDWNTQTSEKVSDLLESVKNLRSSLAAEQTELVQRKIDAETLKAQLDQRNNALEITKGSKENLLSKTQAEVVKYDDLIDDLQEQREAIEKEIEDLESGKIGELNLKDMPGFKKGVLSYPVKSVRVSQGYGKTSFSKNYASGKHNGIDFTGSSGTPILAADDGKVVGTGNLGKYAYGRWIAIDHGNGIITLYGHLKSVDVSRGDKVERGEEIGGMGSTGFSTGTHVHFTVFSSKSYEVVDSKSVKGLKIPIGATVNPNVYLP